MTENGEQDLERDRRIVRRIIDYFGSQERLASRLGIDQSAVCGWHRKGVIPATRQRQILRLSGEMVQAGERLTTIVAEDFFSLPEEREEADPDPSQPASSAAA